MKKLTFNDPHFINMLELNLRHKIGNSLKILSFKPQYGGDINTSFKLETSRGDFFIKLNDANIYPGMFEKEARGLETLRATRTVYVPQVILTGEADHVAYLVLEYIENDGRKDTRFWQNFGRKLAALHRHTNTYYGFEEDNYIGSLIQINTPDTSWANFYIEKRLKYQLKLALNKGLFSPEDAELFEELYERLPHILPEELPHLLHGDLWAGNFLTNRRHGPVLIDPAVYYGSREVDLAMTLLFGGFTDEFYAAYHEAFPLQPGWQSRMHIYQLYPLLVHANLFGGSYVQSVMRKLRLILKEYGK